MAFFILVYVGVEVTIGLVPFAALSSSLTNKLRLPDRGWIFTYLLTERGGGPSSGYVSSGFFGGLTLGSSVTRHYQRKKERY